MTILYCKYYQHYITSVLYYTILYYTILYYILVGGFNHLEKYESQWEG